MTPSGYQIILEKLKRSIFECEDFLFEKTYRLDIGGVIKSDELVAQNNSSLARATAYHAVWCRNLRELLAEARKTNIAFETFVDIGAGKGKACFYAHLKMPEIAVVGVEFSSPLVEIANINKQRFTTSKIDFINADAIEYVLPDTTNLVFMFNPFDHIVLEEFIANNLRNFSQRRSVIAYANDVHRASLGRLGFKTIFRNETRHISLHQFGGSGIEAELGE